MARSKMTPAVRAMKKEVSRKASMANKRLRRLEKAGYHDSPAYKAWKKQGGQNFSVKGKGFRELQKENARVSGFLRAKTGSVRGTNAVMKTMAKNTGIKYSGMKDLHQKSAKFFDTVSKVTQYLNNGGGGGAGGGAGGGGRGGRGKGAGNAIGYQQIWTGVSIYAKVGDTIDVDVGSIADGIVEHYETTVSDEPVDFWESLH